MTTFTKNKKSLIVIVGPTAVGKTALSIRLAKHFKTEVLSADSRQFYREISIGTAKPNLKEMEGVPHHFINSHSISEDYNVSDYEKDALKQLSHLFKSHSKAILVGGSGMYVDALCYGMDEGMPDPNETIRSQLNALLFKEGIEGLQAKLKKLDPDFYERIDLQNVNRLIRAIEVCLITGKTYSSLRVGVIKKRPFDILRIGLDMDRTKLYDRINQRVDQMVAEGLEAEVKSVVDFKHQNALKTVGYREFFNYFEKKLTKEEAIEKIKVNSRRYAKRQLTWFKKDENTTWFLPHQVEEIVNFITISSTNG
jgi:tRNA dimethylallyltransferase